MMRFSVRFPIFGAIGLMLLSSIAAEAMAQREGSQRGGFGFGGPSSMLRLEQVQKELEIVPEQLEQLKRLNDDFRAGMRDLFSGLRDAEDRRAAFAKVREEFRDQQKAMEKKIDEVLLPHQRDRLKQITLQQRFQRSGTSGALDSDALADLLGITDTQKEKLAKVSKEVEEEVREEMAKIREDGKNKILKVLTAAQRKKLEDLLGDSFEIDRTQFFNRGDRSRDGDRDRDRRSGGGSPDA